MSLEYYKSDIGNQYISYIIKNDICFINTLNINYDDAKVFIQLLNNFCNMLDNAQICKIVQLCNKNDYEINNELNLKFKLEQKFKDSVELSINTVDFPEAFLRGLGLDIISFK